MISAIWAGLIWFRSISNLNERRCLIMCFSRQSFCKVCKNFLRVVSFYPCKLHATQLCEKRLVYSKFFEVCVCCRDSNQVPKSRVPFIPRVWTQKGPEYQTGFQYTYIPSNRDIAVVYNGFHVVVIQKGKKYCYHCVGMFILADVSCIILVEEVEK